MYELIQIKNNTYYIDSPAKIGLYKLNETDVVLIDTGNDKDAGRKVLNKTLKPLGWNVKYIINTHSNADHIGGNEFVQKRTECKVFSAGVEKLFTEKPIMEPSFLYGGYPFKELRNKFLMAVPSKCSDFEDPEFPEGFEIIPLPGHFFDMVGVRTPDNVVFLADCLFGENIVKKYHIFFIYDVREYLNTLDKIKEMKADVFVPSHAEVTEDISLLAEINRNKIMEIIEKIKEICAEPIIFEDILQKVFQHFDLVMDVNQYVLVGSTIRSYLSYLKDEGILTFQISDSKLYWKTV